MALYRACLCIMSGHQKKLTIGHKDTSMTWQNNVHIKWMSGLNAEMAQHNAHLHCPESPLPSLSQDGLQKNVTHRFALQAPFALPLERDCEVKYREFLAALPRCQVGLHSNQHVMSSHESDAAVVKIPQLRPDMDELL